MATRARIEVLERQLTAASMTDALVVDPVKMRAFLVHDNPEHRDAICQFLAREPIYKPNYYLSVMEQREQTLQRLIKFVDQKFFSVTDYMKNPRKFMASLESLFFCDYSLAIKAGVHFTLCGGTICNLGTAKHHQEYLPRLDTLSLTGSFSMTELGHGSNVMGIETTAEYDKNTREFIINTPNNQACKAWIGGTAQHGKITAVFAQLTVNGKWEGPHVFMVRIRDDNLGPLPGVRIVDMGPKQGLNGVDNGQVWFDHVRVGRDAMLDAYASVDDEGNYHSPIKSVGARFGTMVGGLTAGRLLIAQGGVDAAKMGLTIAIRYGCERPQFGNMPIMAYVTHQRRLLPALANTYALHLAMGSLKRIYVKKRPEDAKLVHVLSSGIKAAATWTRVETLQNCRECCGGMGFLSANKIGPMMNDMNVDVTFEGDNTVLMQQVARALLDDKKVVAEAPVVPKVSLSGQGPVDLDTLHCLLKFHEHALAYKVGSQIATAAASAQASGEKSPEKAVSDAFDANLDRVVSIGWAFVERFCLENFVNEIERADMSLRPALRLLAQVYGMTRVEKNEASYLSSGVLTPRDFENLRSSVASAFRALIADGGRPALALCDGFGILDSLLTAPIAHGWQSLGQ